MNATKTILTVRATIEAPVEKVWNTWTTPAHIMKWNSASNDWHTPYAENDLRTGGKFKSTMAAKDGSASFDFEGTYTDVKQYKRIAYAMSDGRTVQVVFEGNGNRTAITEAFDAETENPIELQQQGWQEILDNFKRYTESLK